MKTDFSDEVLMRSATALGMELSATEAEDITRNLQAQARSFYVLDDVNTVNVEPFLYDEADFSGALKQ